MADFGLVPKAESCTLRTVMSAFDGQAVVSLDYSGSPPQQRVSDRALPQSPRLGNGQRENEADP